MILCLLTHSDMLRSPLADRLEPPATNIQNDCQICSISTQLAEYMRLLWRKMDAVSVANTVYRPPVVTSASSACALSP
jgi:hypothetical protein